jgi:ribose transport system permease protein
MNKVLGILGLLVAVCLATMIGNPRFLAPDNIENLIRWTALFGLISIGVAFVIITGGIDLSIGSVIALTGCLLAMFLETRYETAPDRLTIAEVRGNDRVVVLTGDTRALAKGDRLQYRADGSSSPRFLTIAGVTTEGEQSQVRVTESVAAVTPQTQFTLLKLTHMNVLVAVGLVLAISAGIGLLHGLLITKMRLQPFVVTLCGLLFYRGYARYLTNEQSQGFGSGFEGLKYLASGRPFSVPIPFLNWIAEGNWSSNRWDINLNKPAVDATGQAIPLDFWAWVPVPMPVVLLVIVAVVAAVLLNYTVFGRYLLALGRNEQAARYSGIQTDRIVIIAYVICSVLAGVSGILFALDLNSIQPASHGNFYELYAIAAAVLGGCSLRGGEGSILGVLIGTAVMRVLSNSIILLGISTHLEFAIIGLVLLAGVVADELVRRYAARRRARIEAAHHG